MLSYMYMKLSAYVVSVIAFFSIDAMWLGIMTPLVYRPALGEIISDSLRVAPALVFYTFYALGIVALIVKPAYQLKLPLRQVARNGSLFGALAYGTYELTNYATIAAWPLHIVFLDVLWGGFITGLVAAVVYRFVNRDTDSRL